MNSIGLSITIEFDRPEYKAKDRHNLRFTLTNDSDKSVHVLKWHTPLEGFNSDMFRVEKEGELAVYLGRVVKRGLSKPEDYVTLEPRGSKSVELDLAEAYDICEAGDYSVEFTSRLLDVGWEEPEVLARKLATKREFVPMSVRSNVAGFKLLESRKPRQLKGVALERIAELERIAKKVGPTFNKCSQNQQNTLKDALDEAERIAQEAKLSLLGTPEYSRPMAVRYKTWFGNYDKQRYDKVTSNFEKIWDALANKGITFNCDCNTNDYAYVYPTKPYEIFLCKSFWSAPMTGTDSKAGTIVHETSHFNVVTGTHDHVYGQAGCQKLAIDKPFEAIENADSHEYFDENNPPLFMTSDTEVIYEALFGRMI